MPYVNTGGRQCVKFGCTNNQKKLYDWRKSACDVHGDLHENCPCLIPYKFHNVPKSAETRQRWLKAINRKDFQPGKSDQVCSVHFVDGRPTKQNPDPQLELGYAKTAKVGRRALERRIVSGPPAAVVEEEEEEVSQICQLTYPSVESEPEPVSCTSSTQTKPVVVHDVGETCTTYKPRSTISTQTQDTTDHKYTLFKMRSRNIGTQTELSPFYVSTNKDCLFYTGVTLDVFKTLVDVMSIRAKSLPYSMNVKDQLMLTLVRLRLALPFQDLGRRFDISCQLANKIFHSWINILSVDLKEMITWLPRETIQRSMPDSFKECYPKTTCIIDCTEVYIQRPLNLKARTATYSFYKSHNTVKILVAIALNGYIMFLSKCYGGRASDRFITKKSGFLNYLKPNDEVMADRGFTIGEELFAMRVKLNMPAFLKGRKQLPEKEVTVSRRIASVRIHVERAIRCMKTYRILNMTVAVRTLKKMNKIVKVVGALCNLRRPLINETD